MEDKELSVEELIAKLTPKQKRFCEEYLIDLNGSKAAIRAGYSKESARQIAYDNFTKHYINDYIAYLKEQRNKTVEITSNEVLRRLRDFAMGDITKTMTLSITEFEDLPDDVRLCISKFKKFERSYEVDEETITETTVELWFVDKLKAWDMIARHMDFYNKDNKSASDNVVIFKLPDNGRG